MMGVDAEFEIARELIETEVPLFLLGAVTADAVLLDEGFVRLRCPDLTGQAQAKSEERKGAGEVSRGGHGAGRKRG